MPGKDAGPQLSFKLPDLFADPRLGGEESFRRLGDAEIVLLDFMNVAQLQKLHGSCGFAWRLPVEGLASVRLQRLLTPGRRGLCGHFLFIKNNKFLLAYHLKIYRSRDLPALF